MSQHFCNTTTNTCEPYPTTSVCVNDHPGSTCQRVNVYETYQDLTGVVHPSLLQCIRTEAACNRGLANKGGYSPSFASSQSMS